jgi:hypothetical protein
MQERAKKETAIRMWVGLMGILAICSIMAVAQFMSGKSSIESGQIVAQLPTK